MKLQRNRASRRTGEVPGGVTLCYVLAAQLLTAASILGYRALYPHYVVEGSSMYPTYKETQTIQVTGHLLVKRFDVVVLEAPDKEEGYYLKRIVGLPGETLMYQDGQLWINGQVMTGDRFAQGTPDFQLSQELGLTVIPEGCYFVLGDNRLASKDSRAFGCVAVENIKGIITREEGEN